MNLFLNYFDHHTDKKRQSEIDECLQRNQENKFIKKIIIVNRNERATYGDFFRAMYPYKGQVNIIANADIYFDETIEKAEQITDKRCYALTRWENINGRVISFKERNGMRTPVFWSQDAWIFRGTVNYAQRYDYVIARNQDTKNSEQIKFCLGIPGCDNKIAAMLKENHYKVTNPFNEIKAIHIHEQESRNYPRYQILAGIRPNGLVNELTL